LSNGEAFFKDFNEKDAFMIKGQCLMGFTDGIIVKKSFFKKEFEELSGNGMI